MNTNISRRIPPPNELGGTLRRNLVDVAEIRKEADRIGKSLRELDAQIQAVNWTAEI